MDRASLIAPPVPPARVGCVMVGSPVAHSHHSPRLWVGRGGAGLHTSSFSDSGFYLEMPPASTRGLQCHNSRGKEMGLAHGRFFIGLAWKGCMSLWHAFLWPHLDVGAWEV